MSFAINDNKGRYLSVKLRQATAKLHIQAETTGGISAIIRGEASLGDYALLLRNLLPIYRALENGLERHRSNLTVGQFARRELYRADLIEADLLGLTGPEWPSIFPLLRVAKDYASAVALAGEARGEALVGHAYVRYLGDLSGGQTMQRILSTNLSIRPEHLSYFNFPQIADLSIYREGFRLALDRVQPLLDQTRVIEAAISAFRYNIALSISLGRHTPAASNSKPT